MKEQLNYKSIKYRIYPTANQEHILYRTFGSCRFVYNQMLSVQRDLYDTSGKHLSKYDAFKYMTANLKPKYPFLKEVDSQALMHSVFNLDKAYTNFFTKKGSFPKFKRKHQIAQSYTTNCINNNIDILRKGLKLPKLGFIKASIHRYPPKNWMIKSATISIASNGNYYASMQFAYKEIICQVPVITKSKCFAMDYKSNGFAITSNSECLGSPRHFQESLAKIAKEQRKLSRKTPGSKNFEKQLRRVNAIQNHVANQRKDHLHKLSYEITNRYDVVCVESLNLTTMSNTGFGLGKATFDNGYGMFLNFLEYKLNDRGKYFIKVDKWYPSSQICCKCGSIHKISLSERTYKCPSCGNVIDRDYQAAINILKEGLRMLPLEELKKTQLKVA